MKHISKIRWSLIALLFTLYCRTANAVDLPRPDGRPADQSKPVKVYILMGQSNMLGFGRVGPKETKGSLEYLVKEKGMYPHLVDDSGNWTLDKTCATSM